MNCLQQKRIGGYCYGGRYFIKRIKVDRLGYQEITLDRNEAQEFLNNCYLKKKRKFFL